MHSRVIELPIVLGFFIGALSSCGGDDGPTEPSTGTLEIRTSTSNASTGRYTVVVDGGAGNRIGLNAALTLAEVEAGAHAVQLGGLAEGCNVTGDNPRTVSVAAQSTAVVAFAITCVPPVGTLEVVTSTTGPGPVSYDLLMDGTSLGAIAATAARSLENTPPGVHTIGLSGIPANCQLQGANPQSTTAAAGATVTVSFAITCTPPPSQTGTLTVTTTTTGSDPDGDGYAFSIDGQAAQSIGANTTVTINELPTGSHTVTLSGLAANCASSTSNPRPVSVATGATVDLSFAITCSALTGPQWTQMESGTNFVLYGVWGSSATDVFTLGEPGGRFESAIFHYNGQAWSQQVLQDGMTLYGIWGSGPTDVFAVGYGPLGTLGHDGVLLHYDGSTWATMPGPGVGTEDSEVLFRSVWGSSGADVFAVGEIFSESYQALVAHYDGTSWSAVPLQGARNQVLLDVFGSSSSDVYAVGYVDLNAFGLRAPRPARRAQFTVGLILHFDGTSWTTFSPAVDDLLFEGVWASAPNDVFAVGGVGDRGAVYHYDGNSWTPMTVPPIGVLTDVWGTSSSDVYAVGYGTILHYDGQQWSEVQALAERLWGVWGSTATDIFAVGAGGTILHSIPGAGGSARPGRR